MTLNSVDDFEDDPGCWGPQYSDGIFSGYCGGRRERFPGLFVMRERGQAAGLGVDRDFAVAARGRCCAQRVWQRGGEGVSSRYILTGAGSCSRLRWRRNRLEINLIRKQVLVRKCRKSLAHSQFQAVVNPVLFRQKRIKRGNTCSSTAGLIWESDVEIIRTTTAERAECNCLPAAGILRAKLGKLKRAPRAERQWA